MRLDRKTLLATTVLAGFTLIAPGLAMAQTPPPAPAANEVTEVVVTGSRIKRNEFNSASPIQVITADTATLEGLATTSEILQSSSLTAGAFQTNNQLTGFVTLGGGGASNIALRGLGPNRTLVLVDGHRMGPAGTGGTVGPFDLNVVPSAIVDRIEILKDGASSIYGSDAVAGVVNLITKKNLDGGIINASGRIDQHPGGNNYDVNAAWGKVYDRGFWNLAADFSDQEILKRGQRPDVGCAANYLFDPTTFARLDVLGLNGSPACFNSGGSGFNKISAPAAGGFGSLIYPDPGVTYPTPAQGNSGGTNNAAGNFQMTPIPFGLVRQGRTGFPNTFAYQHQTDPLFDNQAIVTGSKLYSLNLRAGYDIGPDTELTGGLLLNRRASTQPAVGQFFPSISTANANNPFGTAFGSGLIVPVSARSLSASQAVDYANAYLNLKGKFGQMPVFGGWDWEMHARASKSVGTYDQNFTYNDRVNAISGASACNQALITISQNQPGGQCSTIPGGVHLFAPAELAGHFTDAEKLFLFGKEQGKTTYDEQEFEATMTGDLFSLPAGKVGGAIGVDYRHMSLNDVPGFNTRNSNLWGFSSSGITKGSDAVKEVFGEVEVPLIKDVPLIKSLNVQASGRYTNYDSYGSNSTYKLGVDWRVTDWMRLRATRGTSFRAPALYELFLANQTGFASQAIDPCIQYDSSGNANLIKNCAAAGVPAGYLGISSSAQITTGGGKGILKAETSIADTLGVVFTPSFIDFSVAVDYTNILVQNEVTKFGSANIVSACYNSASFPANPFCTLVQRGGFQGVPLPASGQPAIVAVNNSYVNVANQIERAIDVTTRYRHDFDFGRLQVDTQMTWDLQNQTQLLNSLPGANYNGTTFAFKGPEFSGNATVRFEHGPWTALWFVQVLGRGSDVDLLGNTATSTTVSSTCRVNGGGGAFPVGTVAPCTSLIGNSPFTVVGKPVFLKYYTEMTAYHSISLRRSFDSWVIQGGIQNLFDERPPSVSTGEFRAGTAALNGYDVFGRRFFFNVTKKF